MNHDLHRMCALTVAGSDSGGGAGIQADLKTFAAYRVHGLSAVAALTAQHTRGVTAVQVPPVEFLRAQIDACFDDFAIGAVKLGMLANAQVIHAVADALETYRPRRMVLDPVMVATSGAHLLEPAALDALRTRLLPMASVITLRTTAYSAIVCPSSRFRCRNLSTFHLPFSRRTAGGTPWAIKDNYGLPPREGRVANRRVVSFARSIAVRA